MGVVLVLAVGAAVVCIMMWLCVWPMKKRSKVQVNERTEEVFFIYCLLFLYTGNQTKLVRNFIKPQKPLKISTMNNLFYTMLNILIVM